MTELVKALQLFLGGFGIPAYQENSVPEDAVFPYLTYSPVLNPWDVESVFSARIWDHGGTDFSSKRLMGLVDQIGEKIDDGLVLKAGPGGYIHLGKGSPWAQMQPMQNTAVRVAYLNFEIMTLIV